MKIKSEQTCLIVIDIQNDSCGVGRDDSGGRYEPILQAVDTIEALTPRLGELGVKHAIYTQHLEDESVVPANSRFLLTHKDHLSFGHYQQHSPGAELFRLKPKESDITLGKSTWSAFGNPELQPYLARNGLENIIICGVETEACVFSTIASAYERGFNIFVPEGCVATKKHKIESMHKPVVNIINKYYGFVMPEEELLEVLR